MTAEQAKAQLEEALRRGRKLLEEKPLSKERYDVWDRNTLKVVTSAFGEWSGHDTDFIGPQQITPGTVSEAYAEHVRRRNLERQIRVLEAQIEGLPPIVAQSEDISSKVESVINRKVFVVHGRNADLKYEIAHALQNAGLDVTILHEQPNQGRTILEKFADHAGEAGFAVVLLTADDVGSAGCVSTHRAFNTSGKTKRHL